MLKDMLLKQFKLTLRNRQGLFWTMIFPFILGTLFFFAFRNIISDEIFVLDPIPVAVVEKRKQYRNGKLQTVFRRNRIRKQT